MKICLDCGCRFESEGLKCLNCGFMPELRDGYPYFAPQLVDSYGGFDAVFFHDLSKIEQGNFWFESRNRLLVWMLKQHFPKARNFLEIGCGTGFVLSGIRNEIPELDLYGCDMFAEGLVYAHQRIPQAALFQMDARKIPYENEFDVIGAFDVLEHIKEDREVLAQMCSAVRPDGGIILAVPQHPFLWGPADDYGHHVRRYTAGELKSKVEDAGFAVLKMTSFVSLLFPLMLVSRLKNKRSAGAYDPMSEIKINRLMNSLFIKILDLERLMIKLGLSFPVGGSLLLTARKAS